MAFDSVQPAAQRWFGGRVVEIKQISALFLPRHERQSGRAYFRTRFRQRAGYRGLHARRWRRIVVKDGWPGMPEEQGFLRDVQAAACQQFNTVLAPGSNAYHYDHIHVDLMRRASRA